MAIVTSGHVVESLVVVLRTGEEALAALTAVAHERGIRSAGFSGIGVFSDARIGYLNPATNAYDEHIVDEPTEVVAFSGSIVLNGADPEVHAHVALGRSDTTVLGGHLLNAHVHPTLEVLLDVYDMELRRCNDAATGQELIAP